MPRMPIGQIKGLVSLIQDTVEASANAIEDTHLSIARRPFEVLRHVYVIAGPAKAVEHIQIGVTKCVYHTIRAGNQMAGTLATRLLDRLEERQDGRES